MTNEEFDAIEAATDTPITDYQNAHELAIALSAANRDRRALVAEVRRLKAPLHGQPFGFTRADVSDLRAAAKRSVDEVGAFAETDWTMIKTSNRLHALADRIAALLPPDPA